MSPELAISSAVPRSGCLAMSMVGNGNHHSHDQQVLHVGGSGRSCRYQAANIGTASFMISEG